MPTLPEISARLAMPYIQPAQAQKHVTHNEALRLLDVVVQLSLVSRALSVPPLIAQNGSCYLVPAGAGGDWVGQAGQIALRDADMWDFLTPRAGWLAMVLDEDRLLFFDGTLWRVPDIMPDIIDRLGIQTSADATNRLAVAGDASLFTHDGSDHQMKINKAGGAQTASVLFQSGWSGRAEMGLAGNDDFTIKTSADGTTWLDALRLDAGSGLATGLAVTQDAQDSTVGRLLKVGDSAGLLAASPLLRVPAGGSANALALTSGAGFTGPLPDGLELRFRAGASNTGAATLTLDSAAALPCRTVTGAVLPAGYIRTDTDTVARHENGLWVLSRMHESGMHAQGRFERLENGILRVWALRSTQSDSAPTVWEFPASFAVLDHVSATAQGASFHAATISSATVSQCNFDAWTNAGTRADNVDVALSATGTWY
ncbi:DUF2793 domain-containing protein [Roseinatronobacter sp. S2]|uniref:DUF2793 domain-containing protein n=1 Tax=Roseinatronobacter sp. S2 TaxID=3035471 RepID=UPI00240EE43E|nr:DUF2793 domain-containing protein [Roseinatronobacter sp. S2]WFE73681.1 DUF2793 domain-containing protein [Roseinatronobacter sp. S2]